MLLLDQQTKNVITHAEDNASYLHSVFAWGVFGGACATLQGSPDGQEWFNLITFHTKHYETLGLNVRYVRANLQHCSTASCVSLMVE